MTSIFEQLGGTYTEGNDGMLYHCRVSLPSEIF